LLQGAREERVWRGRRKDENARSTENAGRKGRRWSFEPEEEKNGTGGKRKMGRKESWILRVNRGEKAESSTAKKTKKRERGEQGGCVPARTSGRGAIPMPPARKKIV